MKVYVTNENNRLLRTLNDGVDLTKWINDQIARGYISSGVSTLASLTDVNLTGVQPDYVLTYDAVTSKWVPKFNAATGGLPAGSNGEIQFNNNNVFGASSNLVWDNTNGRLVINRPTIPSSSFSVTGTTGNNDIITIRDNQDRARLSIPNSTDRIVLGNGFGNIDFAGASSAQHIRVASSSSTMDFRGRGVTAASAYSFQFYTAESNNLSGAAGTETGLFQMKDLQFNPSTQSANYSLLRLNTTINQTSGSNGISRALWITPTLTSAANFRAIQFDNNTGWGLYGNGTANNYLAGRLVVGTTDLGSSKVTIQGEGATSANSALSILNSNSISLLHVRNDGLVGIGTNNPGFSLDVAGRTRTQQLTVTGGNAILTDNGRVVIGGTTIDNSALLNVQSTTRGFLMPRMTTTEKNAIATPATGLQVYDTTLNQINVYNGTAWVGVGSSTVKPVATVTATAGAIPAINLESAGTGIYEIDMTNAGVSATFTAPTNPVNGGVYTFRFTNVTSHAIDFPSTFLDQTGSLFDGGTVFQLSANDFFTTYYNGTNYVCGKSTTPLTAAGTEGQIQYKDGVGLGASSNLYWDKFNSRLGIAALSPTSRLHIIGQGSTNGSSSLTIQSANNATLFRIEDGGLLTLGKNVAGSTIQSSSQILASSNLDNSNVVITPKGTGAFILGPAPDGTATGGAARGNYSVDLQLDKTTSGHIAAGANSGLFAGRNNFTYAAATHSVVLGGFGNGIFAGTNSSIIGGQSNSCRAFNSAIIAGRNTSTNTEASYSVASGQFCETNLLGQRAHANDWFVLSGNAQTSDIRLMKRATGSNTVELTLTRDGTTDRAVLTLRNSVRVWNAIVRCVAIVSTPGASSLEGGDCISQAYDLTIKRTTTTTAFVGSPNKTMHVHDTSMSSADFIISADVSNGALKIEFQPPNGVASDTVINAMATVYLTEIGY